VFKEEQDVQPAQDHGVDVEEVGRKDGLGLGFQERPPGLPGPSGRGWMPASFRICHTVDGASLYPRPVSSPWMRR
jgi:hypothetical protein